MTTMTTIGGKEAAKLRNFARRNRCRVACCCYSMYFCLPGILLLLQGATLWTEVSAAKKSYNGFQVLTVQPLRPKEAELLDNWHSSHPSVAFWPSLVPNLPLKIFSGPEDAAAVKKELKEMRLQFSEDTPSKSSRPAFATSNQINKSPPSGAKPVPKPNDGRHGTNLKKNHSQNLPRSRKESPSSPKLVDAKSPDKKTRPRRPEKPDYAPVSSNITLDWQDYYSHEVINDFLHQLADAHPDFVEIVSIGRSAEGRDMRVLRTRLAGVGAPNVFLEAGMHAREWISPAVATFIIHKLVKDHGHGHGLLSKVNVHLLAVANPDGYEYSRARSNDRLWRKNRSNNTDSHCVGVDLNRNFGFHWGEASRSDPCYPTYHGLAPFSEVEVANLIEYFRILDPVPILSLSIHSWGNMLLYPFSYAKNKYPDNVEELVELGGRAVDALIQVNKVQFRLANSVEGLRYEHSGTSSDWYASQGSRFVFAFELRDKLHHFVLPRSLILPSGEETWAAVKVMLEHVSGLADETKKNDLVAARNRK